MLAVMHDLALAARFADRVLVMAQGRIVADAPPREALTVERIAEVFGVEAVMIDSATAGADRAPAALRFRHPTAGATFPTAVLRQRLGLLLGKLQADGDDAVVAHAMRDQRTSPT